RGFIEDDRTALERVVEKGISAGLVASTVMAVFAMVASGTYQGRGFFTPVYHAAFIIDEETMGTAIAKAATGEPFYFFRETFVFGMIAHVLVGGVLGGVFAVVADRLRLHGTRAIVGGLVYGLAVMTVMSLVVLPQAANLFGAGQPIARMGAEVGWPTFAAQFAVFGLVLGSWLFLRPQDISHPTRPGAADPVVSSS
ncbi:MAG: hypothetical protein M3357_04775, partial [Actinomycetota bacterium]|nr:hypothetical protein [Actinomycetota bacterium]